jgi:hypothetical protein
MTDEQKLIQKLQYIEALFAGATTKGERTAASNAKDRILKKIKELEKENPPVEYKFTLGNMWSRKLFVALLRRYGIRPYRYYRQRYTTVMARVSSKFVDETLWPEFEELDKILEEYVDEITDRIIAESINADSSDVEVKQKFIGDGEK